MIVDHPRQKVRLNKTITVNNSSRPSNMPPVKSHLAPSGSDWKLPDGPTIGPSAGPTLEIAVAADEKAVKKSKPNIPNDIANKPNDKNQIKKKLSTDTIISSEIGRRL